MIEIDPKREAAIAEIAKSRLNYKGKLACSSIEREKSIWTNSPVDPKSHPWRYFVFEGETAAKLAEFQAETGKKQEKMDELAREIGAVCAAGDGFCFGPEENRPAGWRGSNIIGGPGEGIVCFPEDNPRNASIIARLAEIRKLGDPMARLADWLQWNERTTERGAGFLKDSAQSFHQKFGIEDYGDMKVIKINPIEMRFQYTNETGKTTNIQLQVWPEPAGCRAMTREDYIRLRERRKIEVSRKESSLTL